MVSVSSYPPNCSGFKTALESPFSKSFHTAIPPPAALCDFFDKLTLLFQRFILLILILILLNGFVNCFFHFLLSPAVSVNQSDIPPAVLSEPIKKCRKRLYHIRKVLDGSIETVNVNFIDFLHGFIDGLLTVHGKLVHIRYHLIQIRFGKL